MDSHKDKSSDESAPVPDTSHLAVAAKKPKKSKGKLIVALLAVVVVIAALAGGGLYYKKTQDDKKAADAAAAAKADQGKAQTPEEQITASLTDSVKKQREVLERDDGKDAIESSTAAAQNVGRNLDESKLQD